MTLSNSTFAGSKALLEYQYEFILRNQSNGHGMATLTTVVVACVDSCHYVKSNPIIYVTNLETRKYRYLSERVRAFQAKVATY